MSELEAPLQKLLPWLQELLVHPDGPAAALATPEARRHLDVTPERLDEIVAPSATLTALERVEVYARMYPLRMRDALATDFPVLEQALGCDKWAELVDAYVQVHPSVHQNLNQLGKHLPRFIQKTKRLPGHAFLYDLAELEQAMVLVFDAEESPPLAPETFAQLEAADWGRAVFVPCNAFQVRAFQHPVNAYLQAVKDAKEPPAIERRPTWTAIYRKSYSVWRMGLSRPQYQLLRCLADGRTVAESLTRIARGADDSETRTLAASLQTWFREWVEEGFFTRIELG